MKKFLIRYELILTMTEKELYPDGTDGLGEITPETVKDLIEAHGGMGTVINDWHLYPYEVLTVHDAN